MKLYEKEAKRLINAHGVETPNSSGDEYAVKAQLLSKNRASAGGVKFCGSKEEAEKIRQKLLGSEFNGETCQEVLIEEKCEIEQEYYISLMYDTDIRQPRLIFSKSGGSGVESSETATQKLPQPRKHIIREFLGGRVESSHLRELTEQIYLIAECFFEEDCRLLEINPLAKTPNGFKAVDAAADLDEDASYRRDFDFDQRSDLGREYTDREKRAKKIDEEDHRGVAGKYIELDGDIGMMLAGGGASLTNMDAMMEYGGSPANYTEYGGNPPTEKVYKLSKVIMSKDIKGLWHVGGTANNTDIDRTMEGFIQALEDERPEYPIVIRRDGPNADKAFQKLRDARDRLNLDMKLFRNTTPMTVTAKTLVEMIE